MSEKLKPSQYNHFIDLDNGRKLVFNAISCGLGELDAESYQEYLKYTATGAGSINIDEKLLKELKKGQILIPEELSEIDMLRVYHYQARFSNKNFGLTLVPTSNCNFACDYCYEDKSIHSVPARKGGIMSEKVCNNLIKLCKENIPEKSMFAVNWYGGEPMLAKRVIEKLTESFTGICKSKKSSYHAGMITNGYLLTGENIDFIKKNRITTLQITMDGPKEIHDLRRPLKSGGGTYDIIISNLDYLLKKTRLRIQLRINIDKRNKDSVSALLQDFRRRGFHKSRRFMIYFGQTISYSNACPDIASQCMMTSEFSDFMIDAFKLAVSMGFTIAVFPSVKISSCGGVVKGGVVVESNGDIQNCWNTIGLKNFKTGELTAEGIKYNYNLVRWLGWNPFREECVECGVLPLCMGGCPFMTIYRENVPNAEKITCMFWKYNLKSMLEIAREAKQKGLLCLPQRNIIQGKPENGKLVETLQT